LAVVGVPMTVEQKEHAHQSPTAHDAVVVSVAAEVLAAVLLEVVDDGVFAVDGVNAWDVACCWRESY